jgi:hypothetical protein
VRLVMSRRFEPGTRLAVELASALFGVSYLPLARVCWARAAGVLGWQLGCAWEGDLVQEELHPLVGPAAVREGTREAVLYALRVLDRYLLARPARVAGRYAGVAAAGPAWECEEPVVDRPLLLGAVAEFIQGGLRLRAA